MPLDFPDSPLNGNTYNAAGKTWIYNNNVWTLVGVSANIGAALSTTALDGGDAETIQFNVMGAVNGGGATG